MGARRLAPKGNPRKKLCEIRRCRSNKATLCHPGNNGTSRFSTTEGCPAHWRSDRTLRSQVVCSPARVSEYRGCDRDASEVALKDFLVDEKKLGIACRKHRTSHANGWAFPTLAECRGAWERMYGPRKWDSSVKVGRGGGEWSVVEGMWRV